MDRIDLPVVRRSSCYAGDVEGDFPMAADKNISCWVGHDWDAMRIARSEEAYVAVELRLAIMTSFNPTGPTTAWISNQALRNVANWRLIRYEETATSDQATWALYQMLSSRHWSFQDYLYRDEFKPN